MAFDWYDALKTAITAYEQQQQSKGKIKFTQIPEDPTQAALRKKIAGYVDNSPTRSMYATLLEPRLKNGATWAPAPAKYGYAPSSVAAPKYDFSKMFAPASTPAAAAALSGPSTQGVIASRGINPATIEPPPTRDFVMDDEFGGGGGPTDGQSIYDYLSQNPGGHVGKYLPNQGESSLTPNKANDQKPEFAALQSAYGPNTDGGRLWELAKKYGPDILFSYFLGPLAPLAKKIWTDMTGTAAPSGQPSGSGFIPGSFSGQPPAVRP